MSLLTHNARETIKKVCPLLIMIIYISALWTNNKLLNILIFSIGMITIVNIYYSMFTIVMNNTQVDLGINKYSQRKKFLLALATILVTNLCWLPTLIAVAISSKIILDYALLSNETIINIGGTVLILIPFTINLITFYSHKDSIIANKDYFKAASSFIILCIPLLFLIDAYWPLTIVTLLKDQHLWGLVITAPLFRFLIEIHTLES